MNIIVTGASRGIGKQIAKQLLAMNHTVIGIARSIDHHVAGLPGAFIPLPFDLDKLQGSENKLLQEITSRMPSVDILINNAGTLIREPFKDTTWDHMLRQFSVNVFAPAMLIKLLLPLMKNSNKPHVLNIGSMAGFQGSKKFPGIAVYSATKAALACLTECLSEEYRSKGITFNCLALGAVQTEMFEEAFPGISAPLTPAEAGAYIADFAVKGSSLYNGKILPVTVSTP